MSSFVLNSFPLIVPRRGPEIQICLSGWISWARTNPTPPPMCFYDEPDQSYKVTLLPFILDCLVVLQFIFYPINLRPSTVFFFFVIASLYDILSKLVWTCLVLFHFHDQSMALYGIWPSPKRLKVTTNPWPPPTKIWPFMVLSPNQNRGKSTHLWPT